MKPSEKISESKNEGPRLFEVKIYFSQKEESEENAEAFFRFYEKKRWRNKKRELFKKWKVKAWQWIQRNKYPTSSNFQKFKK